MAARLFIQSDWVHALRKNEGEAWVSCKIPGKRRGFEKVSMEGINWDDLPKVYSSMTVCLNLRSSKWRRVEKTNQFKLWSVCYSISGRVVKGWITCVDISCGGGLGVSTSSDGTMKIWQTTNGETRRELVGHICDVNCCRFFPSGLVVLSGGMDTQVKIWSAQDGSCPVTLKGHRGGILDTAIVDRGRNVVSCSRDGTARLWDCGKSVCLGVIADCGSAINGVAVGVSDNTINLGSPEKIPSDREVGTEGKLLLLAREDKKLQAVGLQSRQPVTIFVSLHMFCTILNKFLLLAGGTCLDLFCPQAPVQTFHRSGAPVFSLMPCRDGFIACQADGSFIIQQDLDHVIELTGPDCDTVYKAVVLEKSAYTCCRDGIVRKYLLSDL
uniref:Proteasomal ATPase associated factor 1 n=1 Tax=Latimeria chalumnae TaxID=7897 RepID=H3A1S2_LATCH